MSEFFVRIADKNSPTYSKNHTKNKKFNRVKRRWANIFLASDSIVRPASQLFHFLFACENCLVKKKVVKPPKWHRFGGKMTKKRIGCLASHSSSASRKAQAGHCKAPKSPAAHAPISSLLTRTNH